MKACLIIALMLGVALAQEHHHKHEHHEEHRTTAEVLIMRGEHLLHSARRSFEDHKLAGRTHLLQALEQELTLVEALIVDLKQQQQQHANPEHLWSLHHRHKIEEALLFHENRLAEELAIVNEHQQHRGDRRDSVEQLVHRGEQLIRKAQDLIQRHHGHSHREVDAAKREIRAVQKLIDEIRAKNHGEELRQQKEALARHERSLAQLIERLESNHHHHHERFSTI